MRPEEARSRRGITPREAAKRLGCTEPTVKRNVVADAGLLEGFWDQPGENRRWTIWEDSVERAAQAGGLRGTRYASPGPSSSGTQAPVAEDAGDLGAVSSEVRRLATIVDELAGKVARISDRDETYWRDRAERLEQVLWQVVSAGGELATATADHAATSERLRAAARAQALALNLLAEPDAPADDVPERTSPSGGGGESRAKELRDDGP